jgi:hypothetical protein
MPVIAAMKSARLACLLFALSTQPLLSEDSPTSLHFDVTTRQNDRKIADVTFGPKLKITDKSRDPIIVTFEINWNNIDHLVVSPVGNLYDEVSVFPKNGAKWTTTSNGQERDEPGWKSVSTPNLASARQLCVLIRKYSGARIVYHYWPRGGI